MSYRRIILVTSLLVAILPAPALADPSGGALVDASGAPTFAVAPMRHLAAGSAHTCVVLDDESLRCFGSGADGRLGLGDTNSRGDGAGEMGEALPAVDLGDGARVVQVAAGEAHTCAVLRGGLLKCWGEGADGRLGLGGIDDRGDESNEMGDDLPAVDLGAGAEVEQVVTGRRHTCAILRGGAVKCFGRGADGQLGYGDTSSRGDQPGEMGDALPSLALGRPAVALAAGDAHTCARLEDDSVVCWGDNEFGQLGRGDRTSILDAASATPIDLGGARALAVAAGGGHTCVITDAAELACVGSGSYGQLGTGDTEDRGDEPGETGEHLVTVALGADVGVRAAAAGGSHTCLVTGDGALRCFGFGGQGRLGYGGTASRTDATADVDLGAGRTVRAVAAGDAHTCVILDDGSLKCVGSGGGGRRGSGDISNAGHIPTATGDAVPAIGLGVGRTARTTSEPGAAFGLTATAGDERASLSWSAPASDGGATITDYVVEWRELGGTWAVLEDGVSASASATLTGLTNGSDYEFRVRARNDVALGAASVASDAFRPVAPPTTTTVPSGGSSGGSRTTTTTAAPTTTTVPSASDAVARGIAERRRGARRVTLPAFEFGSVAITPAQRAALRRVAGSLRPGTVVRCLAPTSDPRLVASRTLQRAAVTCRALRALAPGVDARVRVVTLRPGEPRAPFRVVVEVRDVGIRAAS